ncbi:MAG: glycosyltransferase, partial [Aliifodinibius sp.]|nr:glycosyltransferase family 4 protein [Fodinibius sp.]NIV13891.1 glycosyltransferase [Fodinibius sp.]NIY27643.1 glycosyltransferase [Fodinibius sp.]
PTVKALLKQIKPDILHSHYLTSYGLLGALSGFTPLIATAWGSDVLATPQNSFIYRLLLRYTLSRCNIVTSDSAFMGDEVMRKYHLAPDRMKIIPLGVDLTTFNHAERSWPEQPPFILLSMRFLDANANLQSLIKALPAVTVHIPDIKLIVTHHGPELSALKQLVKHLDLENIVAFQGLIPHHEVAVHLKQADLYFSLLNSDATSVNLLEAMACGSFPIVSDIPANREWISDGENGYIVSPQASDDLAKKIISALKLPHLRIRAAKYNWDVINQKANWESNMQAVFDIYNQQLSVS